jgi:crotonobetaine/carnitine-CoA ligase
MPSFLQQQAESYPDNTFLIHGDTDEHISFREMNERANAIGNSLRDLGLETGEKVSLLCSIPPRAFELMFGITKAGGVASPINYEYFGRELSYQINDTNPEFLFVENKYGQRLGDIRNDLDDLPVLIAIESTEESEQFHDDFEVIDFPELLDGAESSAPDTDISWHDEALILYTSGTTGDPKGVVISHRMVLSNQTYPMGDLLEEEDVYHNPLPTYHFGGVGPVWAMLHCGGTCVLWDRFSTKGFWDRVEQYGVTACVFLSVMIDWIYNQPEQPDDAENPIKYAALQPLPDFWQDLANRFGFDIINAAFAQTETGNPLWGLIHAAQGENGTPEEYITGAHPAEIIEQAEAWGVPVVNEPPADKWMGQTKAGAFEVAILDEHDEKLPPGESGQMAIRPTMPSLIMERYYNSPRQTMEANRNYWFHTGDIARRDEDGHYYFVDRQGNIIRRRGENISPQQLEVPLRELDEVDQVAVFDVPAAEGGEDEVAVVVQPHEGESITKDRIREYLAGELPEYMHPKYVDIWEQLPLTPTKKVQVGETKDQFMTNHDDF